MINANKLTDTSDFTADIIAEIKRTAMAAGWDAVCTTENNFQSITVEFSMITVWSKPYSFVVHNIVSFYELQQQVCTANNEFSVDDYIKFCLNNGRCNVEDLLDEAKSIAYCLGQLEELLSLVFGAHQIPKTADIVVTYSSANTGMNSDIANRLIKKLRENTFLPIAIYDPSAKETARGFITTEAAAYLEIDSEIAATYFLPDNNNHVRDGFFKLGDLDVCVIPNK